MGNKNIETCKKSVIRCDCVKSGINEQSILENPTEFDYNLIKTYNKSNINDS